jgi:hypothetical protein
MHFSEKDAGRDDAAGAREATRELAQMDAIRIAWFRAH